MLVGLPNAHLYFDVGFIVVLVSLLVQGWTIAPAARRLGVSFPAVIRCRAEVELDLPGQLEQEIVGYPLRANSPYLRRGLLPSWARPTLVVRDEEIFSPAEADPVRVGDYVYLLAPPEKAPALDRFFVDMPPPSAPIRACWASFFVAGDVTLGALGEIYGITIGDDAGTRLADHFAARLKRAPRQGDVLPLGTIALVAHRVADGRVTSVGLRLADEEPAEAPTMWIARLKSIARRVLAKLG